VKRSVLLCAALLAAVAPAAAAGQQGPATSPSPGATTLREADARVAAVTYRLALAGRRHCPDLYPLTGMLFHHLGEYEVADRSLMIARYRLDRGPGVLAVLAGSPAADAGLAAGDVLLAVNGTPFPPATEIARERDKKKRRKLIEASEARLEAELRRGPARLDVLRQGQAVPLVLHSLPACPGRVRLARSKQTNAFSLRGQVVMTTSMLAFLANDDELAVVIGHELSHIVLRHADMRDDEGLLEGLGIKPSNVWKREEAADRLGLRLMAAAGYDLGAAIPFWRRYLKKYDWFPQIFRSHPSLKARERIAAEEIEAIGREVSPEGR
jgi:Zn-dependent protease with chaperone function